MQEAYVFALILLAGGTLFCIAAAIQAIKNPRRVWDRQHARDVKNGEPTDESLVRIRRSSHRSVEHVAVFGRDVCILGGAGFEILRGVRPVKEDKDALKP